LILLPLISTVTKNLKIKKSPQTLDHKKSAPKLRFFALLGSESTNKWILTTGKPPF
jgi:hypothetical protein